MFQITLSIISLPFTPQDSVEATQEFSLPEKDLPPPRTHDFLPGSDEAGEIKNAHPFWIHLTGCELFISVIIDFA